MTEEQNKEVVSNFSDLSEYNRENTSNYARLYLMHPEDDTQPLLHEGEQLWMDLYGTDSDKYREIEKSTVNKQVSKSLKGKKNKIDADKLREDLENNLSQMLHDWHPTGFVYKNQVLQPNQQNMMLLLKECPWIKEQVQEFVFDRTNFLGNS